MFCEKTDQPLEDQMIWIRFVKKLRKIMQYTVGKSDTVKNCVVIDTSLVVANIHKIFK